MSDIIFFKEQTEILLKQIKSNIEITENQLELLKKVLRFHENQYYVLNNPIISDRDYDLLFKSLENIEQNKPALIQKDSPTQRVGKDFTQIFSNTRHLVPMLSLQNTYNANDLLDWDKRVRDGLVNSKNTLVYSVETKFDGASISLLYENDVLVQGITRGDGNMGENVTQNVFQIKNLPQKAAFSKYGIQQAEIRGEVIMDKNSFLENNQHLLAENKTPFVNARNAASGSLRLKDKGEVKKRNLCVFVYHLSFFTPLTNSNIPLVSHSDCIEMFRNLGFETCDKKYHAVFESIEDLIQYCQEFESQRNSLDYEIDGLVIKVNDLGHQEILGMTSHHPRWAVAYKFGSHQAESILENVDFQVGRTGVITPVAKIKPTAIGGVTVSSISIFNEKNIREKDLRIGDTILIERAGDVIPNILKNIQEKRTGAEKEIFFPLECPSCKTKLTKIEEEASWRCLNDLCPAQMVERIIYFCSKDAMDIQFLGKSKIEKFYQMGWLNSIVDIYRLPYEKISQIDGFGDKSIDNLKNAIQKSKNNPLPLLILGLGISYVGKSTAQTLCHSIENLFDLTNKSLEELQSLQDIGPKVAQSVFDFFHNTNKIFLLNELQALGLNFNSPKQNNYMNGELNGQNFLFTGTLLKLKRTEAENIVKNKGGQILSSVSSKLNYLVVGEDAGSKLEKAKKIGTINILSEAQFLKLIEYSLESNI